MGTYGTSVPKPRPGWVNRPANEVQDYIESIRHHVRSCGRLRMFMGWVFTALTPWISLRHSHDLMSDMLIGQYLRERNEARARMFPIRESNN